jgi:REP element-mobilizing transposase RayT
MKKLQIILEPGKFYHVFNRGNNGDNIFYKAENYHFFMRRLNEYLSPFVHVFAYCLLPNHFHLLVQVRDDGEKVLPDQQQKKALPLSDELNNANYFKEAKLLNTSHAFHRLFTSYSKAINKQEGRHGSLFENPFKRKEVNSESYFANLVYYIHANPQNHGICENFRLYPWSSYEGIISGKPTKLHTKAVVEWFSGVDNFLAFHKQKNSWQEIEQFIIE